jgi:hypothetical protein
VLVCLLPTRQHTHDWRSGVRSWPRRRLLPCAYKLLLLLLLRQLLRQLRQLRRLLQPCAVCSCQPALWLLLLLLSVQGVQQSTHSFVRGTDPAL